MSSLISVLLCLLLAVCPLSAHAEEYEDVPDWADTADTVPDPAEEVPGTPDPTPVRVEIDPDQLAEALAQALATPEPDPDEEPALDEEAESAPDEEPALEPTPEPTPQIIVIQSTPEAAATAAPSIWDKPFNDYTPTEGLLLVIFVSLCFLLLLTWLR